ncbi:glycosyltransferase [Pseudohaliea rubra]|uniref:glycosyltransferase n=1 Tax=Pseudohaliea rubra TaxID=475795 RepID=UPI000A06FAB2|nr:glycosyltransferase [Pseudohaliea rubra]
MACFTPQGNKPRLLVLASTYPRWSGDHEPGFVHELARRLNDRFEVHVLAPHAPGARRREVLDGVAVERFRYAPTQLQSLINDGGIMSNLGRHRWKWLLIPPFFLAQLFATFRALLRLRPRVVHAHWILPQGLTIALVKQLFRTPFVLTAHGADLFALRGSLFRLVKRWVCAQATTVTVVSEAMASAISELNIPDGKALVRPMGVDLEVRFTPDPTVERIPKQLLFVGRLVEKKGVNYLLEALPLITEKHPDVTLTIVGFGPEELLLREMAARLGINGRVSFLGAAPQESLPKLYRQCGLFVAPFAPAQTGDQEGLGLVLVEALGCGCPVLAGDVAAVRDVLPDSRQRVRPANPPALASAISEILALSSAELLERYEPLFQQSLHRFSWSNVNDAYAKLLNEAVATSAREKQKSRKQ